MAHLGFENFSDAFDYCREKGSPVLVVIIEDLVWKLYKLYPSGKVVFIQRIQKDEETMEDSNVTN